MGPKSDFLLHVFSRSVLECVRSHVCLNMYISIDVVKMSFLMQNHLFYRMDLLSRLSKGALNSIADDIENRFGN